MRAFAIQRGWHTLATIVPEVSAAIMLLLMSSISWADEEARVEKCDAPKGTVAIYEPQSEVILALRSYNLPPPTQLLRLFVQASNCFQVVARGREMANIQQERALQNQGMLQRGSNMSGGQMVAADFVLMPDIMFVDKNAGGAGAGAALGSLFGGAGSVVGAVIGGIKFQEASTTLTLTDIRSSIQVAAAQGTYKKADWAFGAILGPVGGGAYTSTDEGKIVAGALLDNYNSIVSDIAANPSLLAPVSEIGQQNADDSVAGTNYMEGDELLLKMNAKLYEEPDDESREISSLRKNATVLSLGEATDGYLRVYSEAGDEGWVKTFLLKPKLSGASTTNTYQAPVIPVGSYGNNVGSTAPGMPGRPDSMLPGGQKCPPGNVTCCQLFPLSC